MWGRLAGSLLVALAMGVACTTSPGTTTTTTTEATTTTRTDATTTTTTPDDRAALLAQLRIASEAPRDGYDRDLFEHWIDTDDDGCDTRAEVLIAESTTSSQVDPSGCAVVAEDWVSLYDGAETDQPGDLDIDHVVALAEAWDSGASAWIADRRRDFANDLDHEDALIAVTAGSNRSKGDQDPAEWLPPREAAWCRFATAWTTVKVRWELTADEAEVAALGMALRRCK